MTGQAMPKLIIASTAGGNAHFALVDSAGQRIPLVDIQIEQDIDLAKGGRANVRCRMVVSLQPFGCEEIDAGHIPQDGEVTMADMNQYRNSPGKEVLSVRSLKEAITTVHERNRGRLTKGGGLLKPE